MTREEFETALVPSLAVLGALYGRTKPVFGIGPNSGLTLCFEGAEILELALSLETAIQAMATVQELIRRDRQRER